MLSYIGDKEEIKEVINRYPEKEKCIMNDLNDNNEDNTFSAETVIIFDYSIIIWENISFNVIASKKFL